MERIFPNTAAIQIRFQSGPQNFSRCSGALISPSVIITSGHCVYQVDGDDSGYYAEVSKACGL
jgi:V8-like Glu-specific endopeptidase